MDTPGKAWERWAVPAASVLAAACGGPWPALPDSTLFWRAPIAAAGIAFCWRRSGRVKRVIVAALVALGLGIDGVAPAIRDPAEWAALASAEVIAVQRRLERLAAAPAVRATLATSGSEAAPEAPFRGLEREVAAHGLSVDVVLMVDERSAPIAWTGHRAQLPSRLRLVGERSVVAEPGVSEAWLWWREPVLEGGRTVGELLAGVVLPEAGSRRALGVAAGRAAVVAPRWDGGHPVVSPSGMRLVGAEIRRSLPLSWSTSGWASVLAALVIVSGVPGRARSPLLVLTAAVGLAASNAAGQWWLIAAVAGVASVAALLRSPPGEASRPAHRLALLLPPLAASATGVLAWATTSFLASRHLAPVPDYLLSPAPWQVALAVAWAALFVAAPSALPDLRWGPRLLAWAPLAAGVFLAEPFLLGVGAALVAMAGLPPRALVLPAAAGAMVVFGSHDAAARSDLTKGVEATLRRLDGAEGQARAMLESIPESGLAELVRLSRDEKLVVLGRLAGWLEFDDMLPGVSLALVNPAHEVEAIWGQQFGGWGVAPRELAVRALSGDWRLAVLVAEQPYDVLSALAAVGVEAPAAAFDRSGAPIGRGALFRPLAPEKVGRALAEARSWGRLQVGERDFPAFLRTHGTWVVAVPWLRAPWPERALVIAGLTIWGALPFAVWRYRGWAGDLVAQRRTFAGRLRLFSAAATLVPLVLLAQLVPRQWVRQQQRERLELGRALSQPLAATGIDEQLPWLIRDMGATVGLYREGRLVWCSRPDQVALGVVPALAPAEAFVRAVRGWREPLITGEGRVSVFAAIPAEGTSEVGAILGLQVGSGLSPPSPGEWFVIAGLWAAVLSLAMAERVGKRIAGPFRRLVQATQRVERGEPVVGLAIEGDEEVVALSRAFEAMAGTVQRREEELRRERDLLDRVLGTLSAAVVVVDASGTAELANESARRLLGEGDQRKVLRQYFGPEVDRLLERAAEGETTVTTARPSIAPEALWQVTAMPLSGMSGRRLVVMEDLSEVARAERLASLAELARIVAHEVKNPLTPIRLWAEELRAALDEGTPQVVEIARTAAEEILGRVAHLREVAQGFSNLVALEHWERQPVQLGPLVHEVVGEYTVAAKRGITIGDQSCGEGLVLADPTWVRRAVRHLLDNSLRAIGQRPGVIRLAVSERQGEVVVAVADSGGGVPDENLARLFEPHFSTTSEGSGLGLAVVRRVLERAGGHVEARNLDDGLEVRLVFPAASADSGTV